MSFASSLKRSRCGTDGNIMKIKASVVEGYSAVCIGGGVICFGEREMW